jgi:hypothetical protein
MPDPPINQQAVKAMKVAYQEYEEAVQSLTIALQERKPKAVIDEAIRTLETKRAACRTFNEKFFSNYPQS